MTDAHIRELRAETSAMSGYGCDVGLQRIVLDCIAALEYEAMHWTRDDRSTSIRARCAQIINARRAAQDGQVGMGKS